MADSFKTIDYQSAKPPNALWPPRPPTSEPRPGHHWCLAQAKLIAGCYRRDEAHDADVFVSALALVLADYTVAVVNYVTDPRTGVAKAFPNGLPNVGQIREFCDGVQNRQARLERYAALPRPRSQPIQVAARQPGQFSYGEFLEMAARGEVKPRPIGRFEK
jgi:hypothetical protein